jgi:hypothetical protein
MNKPTSAQRLALRLASDGQLIAIRGGFWVSSATSPDQRFDLINGINRNNHPLYVGTTTVYACQRAGWLRDAHTVLPRHLRPQNLTDAGRAALESL